MSLTDRDKTVMLAASQGVLDAMISGAHLGSAAAARGITPRTLRGDVYETAFEWARQECEAEELHVKFARLDRRAPGGSE